MSDERFKQYEPFFGKWKIGKPLGKGSFGRVYEIYSEDDSGNISRAALKVMHIPTDAALAAQRDEQPDKEAVRSYFLRQVERIQGEIQILQECKGQNNIVNYKEHLIKENPGEEGIGWDILIRMELLYPLSPHLTRKEASQLDIIQMWSDIASALVYCEQQNIMHRDIKPANILLGASGQYKLTDFGVAIRNATREEASTRVGTERYMAPEVYRNQSYDKRVDCYSLGCVIYYFLNRRRHVFMPPFPRQTTAEDSEQAERRRINGDEIPPIPWVPNEVNRILRKSMAYRPENRYQHAIELYNDLQYLMKTEGQELRKRPLMFMKKQRGTVSSPKASEKKQTVPAAGEKKDFGRPNLQKDDFGRLNLQQEGFGRPDLQKEGFGRPDLQKENFRNSPSTPQHSIWDNPSPLDDVWADSPPQNEMQENPVQQVPVGDVWGNTAHMPQKAGIGIPGKKGKDSSGKRKPPKKSDDKKRQNKNPRDKNPQDTKSSKSILPIILAVVLFAAGIAGIGFGVMSSKNREAKNLAKTEVTPEPTAADTPMPEPTVISELQVTNTPVPVPTEAEAQATDTPMPEPTTTPEAQATDTPTPEPKEAEPTATNTPTPEPTATNTPTPEPTATNTPTPEPTATNTPTPEPTATNTPTPEPTATNTPTPEPTATNTPTPEPTPAPTTPLLGEINNPKDGGTIGSQVKYKGWVLSNDASADLQMGIDILDGNQVVQSVTLESEKMGSNSLEKRQKKLDDQIVALSGFEAKGSFTLQGVSDGTHTLEFYAEDAGSGTRTVLQTITVEVNSSSGSGVSLDDVLAENGFEETSTHRSYENFSIGTDVDEQDLTVSGSQNQVLITGWLNADEKTTVTAILDIDGSTYTSEGLAEAGGSMEVLQGSRYLEAMDRALVGTPIRDMTNAGFVLKISLPFLSPGEHSFRITYNVAQELVEMPEMKLTLTQGGGSGTSAEDILARWASEFPQPTEIPEVTATPAP